MPTHLPTRGLKTGWRNIQPHHHWLHHLFHGRCRFCTARCDRWEICPGCLEDLPWITAGCQHCGMPLASGARICGQCLSAPLAIQRTQALWTYSDDIDTLIQAFKFNGDLAAGRLLAEMTAETLHRRGRACRGPIIPMPLHPQRYRARGFNQSALIAHWLGPSVMETVVTRSMHTPSQRGLTAKARQQNLEQAFVLRQPPPRVVTLLDDVLTTGASLNALAKTLRAGGAEHIEAIVLARAI